MQNDNSSKALFIFISGILLVGILTYVLIKNTGSREPEYENPNKNLVTNLNEVKEQPPEMVSDEDLTREAVESQNSGKEVKSMSDQKEVTEVTEQKLTAAQKLAVKAPAIIVDTTKNYTANLKTSMGDIVITLDVTNRPQTVNNFVYLSRMGFYAEVIFHRVISGFMLQGGDPTGTGMGGPAYKFEDELSAPNNNAKGTISMANSGPNTNGSQFFINLVDNNYLDSKHSVFGKVTQGMDVVEAIGKVKTGSGDKPEIPVVIKSLVITEE